MKKLTYVTGNYGKYIAVKEKFEKIGINIDYFKCDLDEPNINDIKIISKEKARQAYEILKSPVFVADSGFYINNYPNNPGYPGAFAKRSGISSDANGLLETMKDVSDRSCYFLDCLTFYDGNEYHQFFGRCNGSLANELRGHENKCALSNLWYIFIPNNCTKTLSEMTDEERNNRPDNRISATTEFIKWYKSNYENIKNNKVKEMLKMEEIKISSKDEKILLYLEKYMDEYKRMYNMLLEFIDVIGTFSNPVMLHHYNEIKDEKDDKYYAYFSDKEENIYVVCLKSNNRKDIDIIERQTNSGDEFYDLSLSKKTIIKKDNISLLKTKETYSFKNGRVITDNNTFYSIFLGNNIAYQLNITTIDSNININSLLKKLNEYDKELDFIAIINIFGSIIIEDNINFQKADIAFYKDVKKCDSYSVDGSSSYSDSSAEKVLKK